MSHMAFESLPDPSDKFELGEEIGTGFCAKVYKAKDLQKGINVAIKVQRYDKEHQVHIEEEYRVLRDHSSYPNLPDFYGVYRKKCHNESDQIWFALEYCEGGTAVELVNRLLAMDRRMKEEHLAFILHETAKAAVELHRNHFIHRDLRGSNILITKEGEVKLCDFGLTREVDSTFGKRGTCIGSPCWMSPEVVTAQDMRDQEVYGSRADVWSLGITAIELADGKPPFLDMHPTRAMFQIVRNPPPTVFKPSNWSQDFNDFIAECLEKNQENRPYMLEIIEHPFLTELTANEFALQQEIKHLVEISKSKSYEKVDEVSVDQGFIKKYNFEPEKMFVEDLAAIENPVEDIIIDHISNRLFKGQSYSFIGDVLLSLNSNDMNQNLSPEFHSKYKFKSRSENAPHIFAVADLAYQDMMHHKEPQHAVFSGESYSGKTTNVRLFINHLAYLGDGNKGATDRVLRAMKSIFMITNAGTPLNNDSTRCGMQYIVTFGSTGKMSGAIFLMNLLEKTRVSTTDMSQHNFHIFYYLYDYLESNNQLKEYHLHSGRKYRYLRIPTENQTTKLKYCRDDPEDNVNFYKEFEEILMDLDISKKNLETIRKILAAILTFGELRFKQNEKRFAEIEDIEVVTRICDLMRLDEKKFQWALINYCKVKGGIAERKQYTAEEARDARDALAATIYQRLVDWIINKINMNLAFPRAVFGDTNAIIVYDMFGFECFHRNTIEQLMINTINEQMQYHYNQIIFANSMFEQEMDGIPPVSLNYYDNKQTLDHLLTKPEGLFSIIDDVSKSGQEYDAIIEKVSEKRSNYIKKHSGQEISVAHYTGKIIYDVRAFSDTNRDFVPAEMIESLRTSLDDNIVLMFTNQLSKCGNLTMSMDGEDEEKPKKFDPKKKHYNWNTLSAGQFSQVAQNRSLGTVFRATCLQMLKNIATTGENSGCHFVRCIRADLDYKPRNFQADMVLQQMKALAVLDTILSRQQGYSCRITFNEFLNRYQFLAFDFDETVDVTKDNCRLLLVRLKMEGWAIGKSKVFLRYYNDEFLSRLYETQVKKIIKVQSMMRSYIARRRIQQKKDPAQAKPQTKPKNQDEAALMIQKAFRGYRVRSTYGPLLNEKTGQIDQTTAIFLKTYTKRWRAKSLFQVLLHYRAARFTDFVNMSQQVHLYNQRVVATLSFTNKGVLLDKVDQRQTNPSLFGPMPMPTRKLPFRLDDIPYFDTSYMCDHVNPVANYGTSVDEENEPWDAPMQRAPSLTNYLMTYNAYKKEQSCQTNWDKLYDSDVVYQQSYSRDGRMQNNRNPSIVGNSNNFATDMTSSSRNAYRPQSTSSIGVGSYQISDYSGSRSGYQGISNYSSSNNNYQRPDSRRNSLKKRQAPTPPPTSGMRNDASWKRTEDRPVNPVRELQMMGRRVSSEMDTGDDPPFNFKAMLRKTNYSKPEDNNNGYSSSRMEPPQLRKTSTGHLSSTPEPMRYSSSNQFGSDRKSGDENFNRKNTPSGNAESSSSSNYEKSTSNYVEEEIAPGVTLKGYAINI